MAESSIPVQLKLGALWASLMSLYIYNDYFKLYRPGEIAGMTAGSMGPLGPATDGVLIIVSLLLAIPALMIALSVLLPARASCWLNLPVALLYTGVEVLTFMGAYPAYRMVVALEVAVTLTVMALALTRLLRGR